MYEFTWHLLVSAGFCSEVFKLQGHWALVMMRYYLIGYPYSPCDLPKTNFCSSTLICIYVYILIHQSRQAIAKKAPNQFIHITEWPCASPDALTFPDAEGCLELAMRSMLLKDNFFVSKMIRWFRL